MLREHLSSGPEASALVTRGPHDGFGGPHSRSGLRQSKRTYCEHCKKLGHTKDTWWTLHGKPADRKPRHPNKAHSHQASTETQADKTPSEIRQSSSSVGFNSNQLTKLYELFLISKPLVSLLLLCPLVLWPTKVPFWQHLAPCLILLPGLLTLVHLIIWLILNIYFLHTFPVR